MSTYCPIRHRWACWRHLMQRIRTREVALSAAAVERLERAIEKSRIAFEQPGRSRYWIRVKHNGNRMRVLYDTQLRCLVTVWRAP